MKFSIASTLLFTLATASPTLTSEEAPHLVKRASVSDAATLGYASLNGGFVYSNPVDRNTADLWSTTGGKGGTVTTVSTLLQFTEAVNEKNTAPVIVIVKGIITGTANVRIGSNKSVIGLLGSGMSIL